MHGDERPRPRPRLADLPEILSREDVVSAFREAMDEHYRSHHAGTDVVESTLLADDYLHQFRDLMKLLDAVSAELEDFASEFLSWSPMSHEEYLSSQAATSVEPPSPVRARFDEAVARLHGEAVGLVGDMVAKLGGSKQNLNQACDHAAACLRILMDEAHAVARGEVPAGRSDKQAAGNVIYAQFGRR